MQQWGFYPIDATWLLSAFGGSDAPGDGDDCDSVSLVSRLVGSVLVRVRSLQARAAILEGLRLAPLPEGCFMIDLKDSCMLPGADWHYLRGAVQPFAVTQRVLAFWRTALLSLHVDAPMLVTGESGSGKSLAVRALARLLGCQFQQVLLSAESDPSELVGQLSPAAGKDADSVISWSDGVVTTAYRLGQWCFLENFNEADACVLERLNPLLEVPSVWTLSERGGEDMDVTAGSSFRAVATMTTPHVPLASTKELSPALANRFSIMCLKNCESREELLEIALVLFGSCDENASFSEEACRLAVDFFWKVCPWSDTPQMLLQLSLRHFVRVIDCMYKLRPRLAAASPASLVACALVIAVRGQVSGTAQRLKVMDHVSCTSAL
jgi:hypothetical protein